MTTRCRIGMVGAGGVASRHASVLSGFPDVVLAGVTDPVPASAARLADATGARQVPDLDALLGLGLDAVYVCVPPFAHGPMEEAVVAAGLPMFVEKPLGLDVAGPERIAALVEAAGVVTGVGFHWRYSEVARRAADALHGRQLRLVTGSWLDKVPPVGWWTRVDGSGGQLVEQAVHVLDLARALAGEVDEVYAVGDGVPPEGPAADVDGATVATLRFASGVVGTLAATCRLTWKHRAGLELYGDGLSVAITETDVEIRAGADIERVTVDADLAKQAVDRAFVDAVLDPAGARSGVLVDYAEALRSHRLACALAYSAAARQPVRPRER